MPEAVAEVAVPDEVVALLARVAKEWLTFERLRQELINLGATDPLLVSAVGRDVEAVTKALLAPTRDPDEVEKVKYALLHALSGHPVIAKLRFQAEPDSMGLPSGALQAMLQARDDVFARWSQFQEGMQRVGATVCQVCIDGHFSGTGFLISDRHILTAHHCVAPLVSNDGMPAADSAHRLSVVFDDIAQPGKSSGAFRSTFAAAKNWLVFDSRQDDHEDAALAPLDDIQPGRLDFAVICLEEPAGLTAPAQQRSTPRKWIDIRDLAKAPGPQAQMLIAHYPGGADLRLSVGLFDQHSKGSLRVRYRTPAVVGSSGAPCFTVDWKPYALHNAGYSAAHVNQGVPLALIVNAIGGVSALKDAQDAKRPLLPAVTTAGDSILGRQDIAEHVDAILRRASAELALVVTSPPKGGKTFTAELIRSMVIDRGHIAFLLDAEKFAADSPEGFARRLVNEIAGSDGGIALPPGPDSRQRARWISRNLAAWTRTRVARQDDQLPASAAPEAKRTLWVIFDRCDIVKFSQETHDLLVALIADDDLDTEQPLRFLLLGYEGDLGAVPTDRLWRTRLDLVSVSAVLPYMQYVLSSLSVAEDPEVTRDGASDWVGLVVSLGINEIPKLILGLKDWADSRRKRVRAAERLASETPA
jgi:hypothetical protein